MTSQFQFLGVSIALWILVCAKADAQTVFWVDSNAGKIQRAIPVGSTFEVEDILTGLSSPRALCLDPANEYLYWSDVNDGTIQRAATNGTSPVTLVTGLVFPAGLAVGTTHIYWTDRDAQKIQRANLDGSIVQDIVLGLGCPDGIALHLSGQKLYWADPCLNTIKRCNLNGTNIAPVVAEATGLKPWVLVIDPDALKLYFSASFIDTSAIHRANLDGTGLEVFRGTGLGTARGLALDLVQRQVYWTVGGSVLWRTPMAPPPEAHQVITNVNPNAGIAVIAGPLIPALSTKGLFVMFVFLLAAGVVISGSARSRMLGAGVSKRENCKDWRRFSTKKQLVHRLTPLNRFVVAMAESGLTRCRYPRHFLGSWWS